MNIDLIKNMLLDEEGYRKYKYYDTKGFLTIGIGNNLTAKGISESDADKLWPNGMSLDEALKDLQEEIIKVISYFSSSFPFINEMDEVRQAVLIDMGYNMGVSKVLRFTKMIGAIEKHNWSLAASEMVNSKWASDVGKKRSTKLHDMMLTGIVG